MTQSFADLGVPARMAEQLAQLGITEPFPVQAITLPDALAGRDLCGRAPTGSGKTLGFGIPLMARVSQASPKQPTGLVLVPTRELAEQVQKAFVPLGRAAWRFVQAVYGGAPMGPQVHSLRKGASVVVATPGRLLDLIEQGHCDLSQVEVLVIDEADRMADLGFMPDVRKIIEMTPTTRQTMLWSATLDGDVNELVNDHLREPVHHDLVGEVLPGNTVHRFVVTPAMDRVAATVALMNDHQSAVVFVKTRFGVEDVTAALMNAGIRAGSLHGARTQQARQRTLDDFSRGRLAVLVATDVAARGIHVDDVELVVHYDLPDNGKDYQHRSGRTGRAGRDGTVIAFVPPSRQRIARRLIDELEVTVEWEAGTPQPRREDGAASDRPRTERPAEGRGDRPGGDRPWAARNDRPRTERPGGDRPWAARGDRPTGGDRTRSDRPGGDRPWAARTDRPRTERPGGDRPWAARNDRPTGGDRTRSDRPGGDRPWAARSDRPAGGDRPWAARNDRPRGDRPGNDRPGNDRPRSDRPAGDRNGRPGGDRWDATRTGRTERPAGDRSWAGRPTGNRTDGPRPAAARDGARVIREEVATEATARHAGASRPAGTFRRASGR